MRQVFAVSDNVFSPLGHSTSENFNRLRNHESGIQLHKRSGMWADPFYASLFPEPLALPAIRNPEDFTRFEQCVLASMALALQDSPVSLSDPKTLFILSTTKGNISLLESAAQDPGLDARISLPASAALIAGYFGGANEPLIVSHACISGVLAIITGMRMLKSGAYDHAVVAGGDLITRFIFSGFQSFQAVSSLPCRPFDAERNGVSLGEGAATLVLSVDPRLGRGIRFTGGAVTNDANHISGPSRTGAELAMAMTQALKESMLPAKDIDCISAHGTATVYNDEMEAKAIHLAGLQEKPVNSLKANYGHTLGAAGLIETVISMQSMREDLFLPTAGYRRPGTSKPLGVSGQALKGNYKFCLKSASGFGGCNAALVMARD